MAKFMWENINMTRRMVLEFSGISRISLMPNQMLMLINVIVDMLMLIHILPRSRMRMILKIIPNGRVEDVDQIMLAAQVRK